MKVIKVTFCWIVAPFHACGYRGHYSVHGNHPCYVAASIVYSSSADVFCFPNKTGILVWLGDPKKAGGISAQCLCLPRNTES